MSRGQLDILVRKRGSLPGESVQTEPEHFAMASSMRLILLLLVCSCLLVGKLEAVTFKEFRKALLAFNIAALKPHCRIVFQKCAPKLFSMISVLDNLNKRWAEYESIPCIKKIFDQGFPDYNQECALNELYGESIKCQFTDEVLDIYGEKEKMKPALGCLLENAKP